MKKLNFIVVLIILFMSPLAYAVEEDPCSNVPEVVYTNTQWIPSIQSALTTYDAAKIYNNIYCINFPNIEKPISNVINIFSFDSSTLFIGHQIKDVQISGLNISNAGTITSPLLTIKNSTDKKVVLKDITLSNTKSGMLINNGLGLVEIMGATISCADKTGTGIFISADGTKLEGSTISNCGTAIKIAASDVQIGPELAADYDTLLNTLTDNATGIHQLSGERNIWPFNSICGGNGIMDDVGVRPVPLLVPSDTIEPDTVEIQIDDTGKGRMQFTSFPEKSGELHIYKTNQQCLWNGEDYITSCTIKENNSCEFAENEIEQIKQNNDCGAVKCRYIALFSSQNSTMYSPKNFNIRIKKIVVILSPPTTLPIQTTGVADSGDQDTGDSIDNTVIDNPLSSGQEYAAPGQGDASGGDSSSGQTIHAISDYNVGLKASCSLEPTGTVDFSMLLLWIMSLIPIISMRKKHR